MTSWGDFVLGAFVGGAIVLLVIGWYVEWKEQGII